MYYVNLNIRFRFHQSERLKGFQPYHTNKTFPFIYYAARFKRDKAKRKLLAKRRKARLKAEKKKKIYQDRW